MKKVISALLLFIFTCVAAFLFIKNNNHLLILQIGPTMDPGFQAFHRGIKLAFNDTPAKKAKLQLILKDSQGNPEEAEKIARHAIVENQIFCFLGVGYDDTAERIGALAETQKIPLIAPFSGSDLLRGTKQYIFNIWASYLQEMDAIVKLGCQEGIKRWSIVYSDESYGHGVLKGLSFALNHFKLKNAGHFVINKETSLNDLFQNISLARPQAIVVAISDDELCDKFIASLRKKTEITDEIHDVTLAFVSKKKLEKVNQELLKPYFYSNVIMPSDGNSPLAKKFHMAKNKFCRKDDNECNRNYESHEFKGYLTGLLFVEGLNHIPNKSILTGETLSETLRDLEKSFHGFPLSFVNRYQGHLFVQNQGSDYVNVFFHK